MAWVGAVLAIGGTVLQATGDRAQSKAARRNAIFQRTLARRQAKDVRASAQRAGFEAEHQAELLRSRGLALAAASGAGAQDPSVLRVLSGIGAEGAYRRAVAVYEGESRARYLEAGGDASFYSGQEMARAQEISAAASLVQGASSFYGKYGQQESGGGDNADWEAIS